MKTRCRYKVLTREMLLGELNNGVFLITMHNLLINLILYSLFSLFFNQMIVCLMQKEVVEILERGEQVLMAARRGELERLESLLQKGASMNYCDQYGLTALHAAAIKGHRDAVLMLVKFGIDLECKDNEGHVPLHLAVEGGNLETVEVLVDKGADVNARTIKGVTPLYLARAMCYDDISEFLISRGASSCITAFSSS